jgi:hypothetical protein
VSVVGTSYNCGTENWVPGQNVPFSSIQELSKPVDANNKVFYLANNNSGVYAQPVVSGVANYDFSVTVAPHKQVSLSYSLHPRFVDNNLVPTLLSMQQHMQDASSRIATDDDARIPDGDPAGNNDDDVPAYIEFLIGDGQLYLYGGVNRPVFPTNLRTWGHYDITELGKLDAVIDYEGSNIKLVNSINVPGVGTPGRITDGVAKNPSNPARFVATRWAGSNVLLHEFGHCCGLSHRGLPQNPGSTANAVMWYDSGANEINRYERGKLNAY